MNLLNKTIFSFLPKIPISIFIKIIEWFLINNKNGLDIFKTIKKYYNLKTFNKSIIYKIISLIRRSRKMKL